MMRALEWLSEIGSPHKRCARVGHVPREQVRHGYAYPCRAGSGWLGGVADRITEERTYCARCGEDVEPWRETDWGILSGLTMSSENWRLLKRDGRLFRSLHAALPSHPGDAGEGAILDLKAGDGHSIGEPDDLWAALAKIMPIVVENGPDYATVNFGDGETHRSQAMTMNPQDWLDIQAALEASHQGAGE